GIAFNPYRAAALLDDTVHGRQTQSGALTRLLRCVERFKQMALDLLIHSRTAVTNLEHHVLARFYNPLQADSGIVEFYVAGIDGELASLWHGVSGIHREVHNDLIELGGVCAYQSERRFHVRDYLNVFPKERLQHVSVVPDNVIQIQHPGLEN